MDVNSGRLVADIKSVPEHLRHRFTEVPDHLREFAEKALDGQPETVVNMRRRNELTRWAHGVKKKNRARNKFASRFTESQARGWKAVCATLDEIDPDWILEGSTAGKTGVQRACDAIRRLAAPPQPSAAEWAERASPHGPWIHGHRTRDDFPPPDAAVGAQGDGYPNTSDVPDSELREQLSACRDDWQRLCDAVEPGQHFDPDDLIRRLAAPAAGKGMDALEQALTDPENQPSQWGTIPLSMLPARKENPYSEPMQGPSDHDEWTEYGEIIGWNSCLDALTRQPVAGDGWRPIESAPKDGSRVLIDGGVWWNSDCDTKHAVSQAKFAYWKDGNWRLPCSSERVYFVAPVRWMPLSAPAATPTDR